MLFLGENIAEITVFMHHIKIPDPCHDNFDTTTANPVTMGENNTCTDLKGCGVKTLTKIQASRENMLKLVT